jgi:hypothetical protein
VKTRIWNLIFISFITAAIVCAVWFRSWNTQMLSNQVLDLVELHIVRGASDTAFADPWLNDQAKVVTNFTQLNGEGEKRQSTAPSWSLRARQLLSYRNRRPEFRTSGHDDGMTGLFYYNYETDKCVAVIVDESGANPMIFSAEAIDRRANSELFALRCEP